MASVTFVPSRIAAGDFVDVPVPGSGDNGKAVTYNHGTGLFVYTGFEASGAVSTHVGLANPHSQYLLASSYTAADVLAKLLTVDGSGSGLDADLLDGNSSAAFATAGHSHNGGLLADGTVTGATSQAQTFTNGVYVSRGITDLTILDNTFGIAYMPYIYQVDVNNDYGMTYSAMGNTTYGVYQTAIKSRSSDGSTPSAVLSGDEILVIDGWGDDGVEPQTAVVMLWRVDGAVSPGIVPGSIEFYVGDTSGDAYQSNPRLIIKSSGRIGIAVTDPTAMLDVPASTTSSASIRIRSGVAPTSPNDGDFWYDGSNLKFRLGGTTKTITWT